MERFFPFLERILFPSLFSLLIKVDEGPRTSGKSAGFPSFSLLSFFFLFPFEKGRRSSLSPKIEGKSLSSLPLFPLQEEEIGFSAREVVPPISTM